MGVNWKIIVLFCTLFIFMAITGLYFMLPQQTVYKHPNVILGYHRGLNLRRWYGKYVSSLYEKEETQFHHFLIKHTGLKAMNDEDEMLYKPASVTGSDENDYIKYNRNTIDKSISARFSEFKDAKMQMTNKTTFRANHHNNYSKCKFELQLVKEPNRNSPNTAIYEVYESEDIENDTADIHKLWRESCSDGGSLFRAITEGPLTRSFCNTQDFFNGTYQLTCRVYEHNSHISVTLESYDFLIYARVLVKPMKLFNQKMPKPFGDHSLQLIEETNGILCDAEKLERYKTLGNGQYILPSYSSIWVKTNNTKSGMTIDGLHWDLFIQGCPLLSMSNRNLHHCLDKFNNVILIGDSHIRYGLFHLLHKLGKLDPHVPRMLRDTYTFKQFIFKWANWPELVAHEIKSIKRNLQKLGRKLARSTAKPDLILINCGHWDLNNRNIIEYIKGIELVFKVLENFLIQKKHLVRVIWMGLFPLPDLPPFSINGWLYRRLAQIGVEPFDTASIIYPFYEQKVCALHYMCISPRTSLVAGTVGPIAYEALYNYICE